jgi:hypothetical protein
MASTLDQEAQGDAEMIKTTLDVIYEEMSSFDEYANEVSNPVAIPVPIARTRWRGSVCRGDSTGGIHARCCYTHTWPMLTLIPNHATRL